MSTTKVFYSFYWMLLNVFTYHQYQLPHTSRPGQKLLLLRYWRTLIDVLGNPIDLIFLVNYLLITVMLPANESEKKEKYFVINFITSMYNRIRYHLSANDLIMLWMKCKKKKCKKCCGQLWIEYMRFILTSYHTLTCQISQRNKRKLATWEAHYFCFAYKKRTQTAVKRIHIHSHDYYTHFI